MGNTKSELYDEVSVDPWWENVAESNTTEIKKEAIMAEISTLHEKRVKLIAEKKQEMCNLREEVARLKKENQKIKQLLDEKQQTESFEVPGSEFEQLQKQLNNANSEIEAFEAERKEYSTHVTALKDVIAVSKQLLLMKEEEMKKLNQQLEEIQSELARKELEILSDEVRKEYDKQLKSIRQLKTLYEDRQEAQRKENSELKTKLNEATVDLSAQETLNAELQARVSALEKDNYEKSEQIFNLDSQLGLSKADCRELQSQLAVINQLFSQILTGIGNGQEVDLDKLVKALEENHGLLTDIACNEESDEALPKVLLDLVNQVNNSSTQSISPEAQKCEQSTLNSASEIVENLPKVWRVLIELLSHQTATVSVLNDSGDSCYKSVQTPTGPTLVLSVSQTFIRLKNLIVEKKSLEKETARLKQLNTHLETRLQDQEKRLEMVSKEVAKTWHVVGKMQKQHQMLHTQENILRYELAQKRKLLNELKEELEYCREKWMQAREKNSITEKQWKQLQSEFASRKRITEDFNNSVESGYSDDRDSSNSDSDEDQIQPFRNKDVEEDNKILEVVQEEIANIERQESVKSKHEDISDTYKKLEEHILETIKKTQNAEEYPSTSSSVFEDTMNVEDLDEEHSIEKVQHVETINEPSTSSDALTKREERLRRLEEETKELVGIVVKNAFRGEEFSTKLDDLHDRYGGTSLDNDDSPNEKETKDDGSD